MVFFKELVTKKEHKTNPSQADRDCASLLLRVLTKNKLRVGILSVSKYANEIRLIRQHSNISSEQITEVVKWYDKNAKDKYTPRVWNGKSFRDKFIQIRHAMERQRQSGPISMDEEGKAIYRVLNNVVWKNTSSESLQRAVACSVLNLRTMKKLLDERKVALGAGSDTPILVVGKSSVLEIDVSKLIRDIRTNVLAETSQTVTNHFQRLWRSVHNWADWSGKLESHVISMDNKEIAKAIERLCLARFGKIRSNAVHHYIQTVLREGSYYA